MIKHVAVLIGLLSLVTSFAFAESPDLRTPSPVIFLADNLDEADQLGWCIDTVGRGFAESLHAHSCKPRGGDVQFSYDSEAMQISSFPYRGKCMELVSLQEPLGLLDCADKAAQRFEFADENGRIHPDDRPDLCLTVGEASRSAGPYMSRGLGFQTCEDGLAERQIWVFKQ